MGNTSITRSPLFWRKAELQTPKAILRKVQAQDWPSGTELWVPNNAADYVPFLLGGRVRVLRPTGNGDWHVQYDLEVSPLHGSKPVYLTSDENGPTKCVAQTDVTAILVPKLDFEYIIGESRTFRAFVFQAYAERILRLMKGRPRDVSADARPIRGRNHQADDVKRRSRKNRIPTSDRRPKR